MQERVILYLAAFLAVGEVAVSGEPAGSEGLAWIWMLWTLNTNNTVPQIPYKDTSPVTLEAKTSGRQYLDAWRDVINDPDGFAVGVAR